MASDQLTNLPNLTLERRREAPLSAPWQSAWTDLAASQTYHNQITAALKMMAQQTCVAPCGCWCHQRRRKQTSPKLKKIAGTVSIGYYKQSLPGMGDRRCDVESCRNRLGKGQINVTYCLLSWMARKAARLVFGALSRSGEPTRALTMHNVRETNGELFCAARLYDPSTLIGLLRSGMGRPSDVDEEGETLLHTAIRSASSASTVRYLLSLGADPHFADLEDMTPYDRAYDFIIKSGGIEGTTGHTYFQIFPDTEALSSWGLTTLHKIILGMNLRPLDEALTDPDILKEINTPDAKGRTALWWAIDQKRPFNAPAEFSSITTEGCNTWMLPRIKALLDAGADPNIADFSGTPPLRQAMLEGWLNIPMIRLLASYGADLTFSNNNKMSSLHVATRYHDNEELLEVLSSAPNWKKNLNARGGIQMKTPLQIAIRQGYTAPACWLMDRGAEIEMRDTEFRDTAVLYAIDLERYDVLEHMLETHKPDLTARDTGSSQGTLLLHAAAHGDARTFNLLAGHRAAVGVDFSLRSLTGARWDIFDTLASGGWESTWVISPPHVPTAGFARDAFWRLLNTKTCERCALDAARGLPAPVGLCPVGWKKSRCGWKGIKPLMDDDDFDEKIEYVRWTGRMQLDGYLPEEITGNGWSDHDYEDDRHGVDLDGCKEGIVGATDDLPPHGPHVEDGASIKHLWIDIAPPGRPECEETISEKDDDDEGDQADSDTTPLLSEKPEEGLR